MKKISIILFALLVIFGMVNMASATFTTYDNDKSGWATATGSYLTETFSSSSLNPGISVSTLFGSVSGNVWYDRVGKSPGTVLTTTFSFSPTIFAFGGNWDMTPYGPGTGIAVYADGNFVGEIANTDNGQFWGFTSTTDFTNVALKAGSGTSSPYYQETFTLDNMVYNSSATVPEPTLLLLFGAGLLGLGFARKFKM